MKETLYLITLTLVLLNSSCTITTSSDDDTTPIQMLPEATTEGLHTLGCYINGEPWVAETPLGSPIAGIKRLEAHYLTFVHIGEKENYFSLEANRLINDEEINQSMTIQAENVTGLGNYNIISDGYFLPPYYDANYECQSEVFYIDTFKTHQIIITRFDTIAKIVSGTFEMNLYNTSCDDTLRITEGRFDVVY